MKRRNFIRNTAALAATGALGVGSSKAQTPPASKEVFELRVYEMRWGQGPLDEYLSKALIPALNRAGIRKVGAFSELGKTEPARAYVLIPYPSFESFGKISLTLRNDKDYVNASAAYDKIPQEQAVLNRYESSLSLGFDGLPALVNPAEGSRLFELRTYEGYNEDAVRRKVKMFNEGEFDIFQRAKLNSVFFGEMLIGKTLPCLVYMIAFKNMEEREAGWKNFLADPEWEKIRNDPQYANTVSRIHRVFLEPLPYSQV